MNRAADRIWWAPTGHIFCTSGPALVHWCPTAVITTPQHRDQLDPMALGTCRYCGERLPVTPTKGTGSSE